MSNLRDLNQQNSFMDMLSSFNRFGTEHPFSAAFNPEARDRGPPPSYDGPQQPSREANTPPSSDEDPPAPPPPEEGHHPHRGPSRGRHHHRGGHWGRGGGGWGGGWGGRGGHPFARCGGGRGGPNFGGFDMNRLADFIGQFSPEAANEMRSRDAGERTGGKDFAPEADIFDTEDGFVVHVSLPGAKKEDVGVNWDADKSELNIAGVIYRPGDEAFLKTLALDERKVGVFERSVKLGSRERPALVDSESISAKMENGVLIISIPKMEKDFVEVKKVDIN
ncbi:uncharacterized protein KY384_005416 [Bacidia gigantensis]|uniref:uncharacterized protein n=1 Tax=Bacidia gigantensis TaxID=2732470 RepID=UPI001D04D48B|nr:uncharacterized protein KY384_005416 [Bacidia gigantensis]KAG8529935.1 hypothetical protein KY384_005416 [Bacidia gigantensis]